VLTDRFSKHRVLLITKVGLGGVSLFFGLAVLSGSPFDGKLGDGPSRELKKAGER
jgi:hypothetical protein